MHKEQNFMDQNHSNQKIFHVYFSRRNKIKLCGPDTNLGQKG
ncbi:hypothetical protein MtrunA17_Chr1g0178621 [Medicago truncatula]|uniref:Uncharacterized protein n=1 Tax=Medicago truncatula TaxID=3880 RepID=A0A396JTA0_MEDTR|nr:hypothetical protein MtrunA17_Chr1g0178621 [Medicago truncatula]